MMMQMKTTAIVTLSFMVGTGRELGGFVVVSLVADGGEVGKG